MSNAKSFLLEYIQNELKPQIEKEVSEFFIDEKKSQKKSQKRRKKRDRARAKKAGEAQRLAKKSTRLNNLFDITDYLEKTKNKDFKKVQATIDNLTKQGSSAGKTIQGLRPGDKIIGYKDGKILVKAKGDKALYRVVQPGRGRMAAASNGRIVGADGKFSGKAFRTADYIDADTAKKSLFQGEVAKSKTNSIKKGQVDAEADDLKNKKPTKTPPAVKNAIETADKITDGDEWAKKEIRKMKKLPQFVDAAKSGSKKALGKFVATRLGSRLALLAGGPVGAAALAAMTAVDIALLGKLAFDMATADTVGGIAMNTRGEKFAGRSQGKIADELAAARKSLAALDKDDWKLPKRGPGSYESLKKRYEDQIAKLEKERDAPQKAARAKSRRAAEKEAELQRQTKPKAPDFATAAAANAPSVDQMLGTKPQGIDLDTAVAGGPGVAAAMAASGAGGNQATVGTTGRSRSKAGIQRRLSQRIEIPLDKIQDMLKPYFTIGDMAKGGKKTFSESISRQIILEGDGKYGPETEAAIENFQDEVNKLIKQGALQDVKPLGKPDGLFGPKTLKAYQELQNQPTALRISSFGQKVPRGESPTPTPSSDTKLTSAGAKMLNDPKVNKQLEKVAKDTGSDINLIKKDPTLIQVANDVGKGMGDLQKLAKFIKDLETKYKKEKKAKDLAARKKTADAGAKQTADNLVKQDQQTNQSRAIASTYESKAYAYLEKIINEELDKILG